MNNFLYANGLALYQKASLSGKMGRIAFEEEMARKLLALGYTKVNGINLRLHISEAEKRYNDLKEQQKKLMERKRGGVRLI